jgi:hypothetical protein
MIRCFFGLAVIGTMAAAAPGFSQDPAQVTAVKARPRETGSLAEALKIQQMTTEYKFDRKHRAVTAVVQFYTNGKLLKERLSTDNSLVAPPESASDAGQLTVSLVDLDLVRIGDSKPAQHRIHVRLQHGESIVAESFDFAKSTMDLSKHCTTGALAKESDGTLIYFIKGDAQSVHTDGTTLAEILKDNPSAEIMVVSIYSLW